MLFEGWGAGVIYLWKRLGKLDFPLDFPAVDEGSRFWRFECARPARRPPHEESRVTRVSEQADGTDMLRTSRQTATAAKGSGLA